MWILTTRLWWAWLASAAMLAVAAAGAIAAEAWQATRAHRAAAEKALRDHAGSAALTYRERMMARLYFAVDGVLRTSGPVSVFRARSDSLRRCAGCAPALRPSYFLRLTLADSTLEIDGPPMAEARRAELVARLAALAPSEGAATGYYSLVDTMAPGLEMVYFAARRAPEGAPVSVDGFAVGFDSLVATMLRPATFTVLLPLAVPHSIPNDSLLSVTLLERRGHRVVDLSPQRHEPRYSASIPGSRFLGAWTIQVALDPETAPKLIMGGLPPSRGLPLAAMAVAAVCLIGAAVYAAGRALELARLRADFLAGVSHELRTPLSQILLFGESLSLGRMESRKNVRAAGAVIVGEARRLLALVDNVMLFARGERATEDAPVRDEPLAPLVRDAIASFAPVAAASGATVRADRLDDVVAPVDRGAVRQILLNLLDNAAKYGPRGQTISVGLALVDGQASLWVRDQGPGIPARDRERVWQPFIRLERDRNGHAGGSGIGLALVHDLVGRHRGSARIDTTPSGGTCVVISLPGGVAAEAPCGS